jgi:hypothetical protein
MAIEKWSSPTPLRANQLQAAGFRNAKVLAPDGGVLAQEASNRGIDERSNFF